MLSPVEMFTELFRGNTALYGVHVPEKNPKQGQKASGRSYTKSEPVTPELYAYHCMGRQSIGIVPIDYEHNVHFMAIDVDVYPANPKRYCALFEKYNLPLTCFRTKSGGLHAFCFFKEPTPADKALDCLQLIRHLLRLPPDTETFPKQRRLTAEGKGNWINLPYFSGEKSTRYAYSSEGKPLSFKEAVEWCWQKRTTYKNLQTCLTALPFAEAPPCLQAAFINGDISIDNRNRNIFLFNVAVYLKSRFSEEFAEKLKLVNQQLDQPLPEAELQTTIIASHSKSSYTYQCKEPFLKELCFAEICRQREFGKGSGGVSGLCFGQLTQVRSKSPYYKWLINGSEMVFFSEAELRNQEKFLDYCVRYLQWLPNKLKNDTWTAILNQALKELVVEEIQADEDLSESSLWFRHLVEFLTERQLAQRPSQITMGQVYLADDIYYFQVEAFYTFLSEIKRFKSFSTTEIHYRLRNLGFAPTKLYDANIRKTFRAWAGASDILDSPPPLETQAAPAPKKGTDSAEKTSITYKGPEGLRALAQQLADEEPGELLDFSKFAEEDKF